MPIDRGDDIEDGFCNGESAGDAPIASIWAFWKYGFRFCRMLWWRLWCIAPLGGSWLMLGLPFELELVLLVELV